ncbi:hypothetical protein FOS14_17110 [Skermania sp. ID1734]|uniref:phage shock envelope stress response protein PspM n=1 Tax=Skermania sp. ID1734 TaxID=2597516 RepID=UPI00117F8820|nr:hypothetical protein [Skermania sp. ID1734]TSD96076.1 hypothetical protein FOS14_17110 [Skermania sp. ID1734]
MTAWRGLGDWTLAAVRQWADPRERQLRKRRRARRKSIRYGAATGVTAAGAVSLLAVSAPVWAVVVVGSGAVVLVIPAVRSVRRYQRLRNAPLPPAMRQRVALPPASSAARVPMMQLSSAQRSLDELFRVIARAARVPAEDLDETMETAESAAAALRALAADLVGLERARRDTAAVHPAAAAALDASIATVTEQLVAGVGEFEDFLGAAARMAAPAASDRFGAAMPPMAELRSAADRLDGWAEALIELADRGHAQAG